MKISNPVTKALSVLAVSMAIFFGMGAATLINLATQVQGILAIANGGTGTASPAIVAGTGISVSGSWPNQTVTNTGATTPITFSDNEVPSGSINSSNVTFTLAHTPSPALSLSCFLNGVEQRAAGADFTLSTATITYGTAPTTGDTLVCSYRY